MVIVPVNAVATNTLGMSRPFAVLLASRWRLCCLRGGADLRGVFGESLIGPGETATVGILRGLHCHCRCCPRHFAGPMGRQKWWNLPKRKTG